MRWCNNVHRRGCDLSLLFTISGSRNGSGAFFNPVFYLPAWDMRLNDEHEKNEFKIKLETREKNVTVRHYLWAMCIVHHIDICILGFIIIIFRYAEHMQYP